jgi:hypothetical protein
VNFHVQVSTLAGGQLTRGDIRRVVRRAQEEAEFQPDWGPGKTYRFAFKKAGKGYAVALNHRGDDLHVFVGLRQEITRKPAPSNPATEDSLQPGPFVGVDRLEEVDDEPDPDDEL